MPINYEHHQANALGRIRRVAADGNAVQDTRSRAARDGTGTVVKLFLR